MRGLDPRIHVRPFEFRQEKGVDGRVKHGHENMGESQRIDFKGIGFKRALGLNRHQPGGTNTSFPVKRLARKSPCASPMSRKG